MTRSGALTIFVFSILSITAGCKDSDPANGTLQCGQADESCPTGYYCHGESNTCWRNNTGPDAGTDAGLTPRSDSATQAEGGKDNGPTNDTAPTTNGDALSDAGTLARDAAADQASTPQPDGRVTEDGPTDGLGQPDVPTSPDVPVQNDVALRADTPALGPDLPAQPDTPPDTATCPAGKVPCNGKCIDSNACCVASDCTGSCMTCDSTNTCVAVKGQADPAGRCTGTCDSNGACKGKLGQSCTAVGGGCAAGTYCSRESICCDKACTDSCEACDATGTCKPVAKDSAPKSGHPACTATDAACAGKCDGTGSACSYPAGTCGTAACNASVYQPAGTCQNGACSMPATQTCANACVLASGGCTGTCSPDAVQCSGTGIPQKCSSAGGWVNQAGCASGYVCSGGACSCSKTECSGACVDIQTDNANCGKCGHSCQGGTCSGGKCQAVVLASNLDSTTGIIGLDAQYLYYQDNAIASSSAENAYRIGKAATNGSGTSIYTGTYKENFRGVLAGSYLLMTDGYPKELCSVATTTSCASSITQVDAVGVYDYLINFRTMSPDYFAFWEDNGDSIAVGWVSPTAGSVGTNYSESSTGSTYTGFTSSGTAVYWIRANGGDTSLFATKASEPNTRIKVAGNLTSVMGIADANAQSVLLWDGDKISRVPVAAASAPVDLLTVSPAPSELLATEDAAGVYWFDGNGSLNRCTATACSSSKTTLVSGQAPRGGIFQDSTSLYWLDTSSGYRLMRISK